MPEDPALLLPAGVYLGRYHDVGTEPVHVVRVGPKLRRFTAEQFTVWGLAHGVTDPAQKGPWTRPAVIAASRRAGLADPDPVLDAFLADGALIEATPGTPSAVEFARAHRMVPLMLGLGNTADDPGLFRVGFSEPVVGMNPDLYDLYIWSHLEDDLWAACAAAVEVEQELGSDDPALTDPHRVLADLLEALHPLLVGHAVYLDPVPRRPA